MRLRAACAAFLLLLAPLAEAATLHFPSLTGRVVDAASVLPAETRNQLDQSLDAFEQKTHHQLVVVTVKSLEGEAIEEYGVALGRAWGIGRKGVNDGVLLIVAPNERQTRIEVGYGLEGELTDAQASVIIQSVMLPEFRRGNIAAGVVAGTRAIISTLGGEPYRYQSRPATANGEQMPGWVIILFVLLVIFLRVRYGIRVIGGGGFGGSGGGGFSGGGGSFGGGGSSGRW